MKLTYELIQRHRSVKGGWTKLQLEALGVTWPPKKGWAGTVVGKELSDSQFSQFTGQADAELDVFGPNEQQS